MFGETKLSHGKFRNEVMDIQNDPRTHEPGHDGGENTDIRNIMIVDDLITIPDMEFREDEKYFEKFP